MLVVPPRPSCIHTADPVKGAKLQVNHFLFESGFIGVLREVDVSRLFM